ncbi:hypothetical protein PsAD37_02800 [Pseudovibrio sp. Ad37]|nr:hypothetical protein PsAD37_02800 [Pseudovibrio sp. Ad37]
MFNEMHSVQVTDYSDYTPLDPTAAPMLKLYGERLGLNNMDLAEIAGTKGLEVDSWWHGAELPAEGFLAILHFGSRLVEHNANIFAKQCFAGRKMFPVFLNNEMARVFEDRESAEGMFLWSRMGQATGMFATMGNLAIQRAHEIVCTRIEEQLSADEAHFDSSLDVPVFKTAFFDDLPYEEFRWRNAAPSPHLRLVK